MKHAGRNLVRCVSLLVCLFCTLPFLAEAQTTFSRPVGFVRVPVQSDGPSLLAAPFHAFGSRSNVVLTWDATSQRYIPDSDTGVPMPGQGFWMEPDEASSAIFLYGELVLDETWTLNLLPGLNLVGYPYATVADIADTELREYEVLDASGSNRAEVLGIGRGYWLKVTGDVSRVWVETRPYEDVFEAADSLPQIIGLDVLDGTGVVLRIRCAGDADEALSIYWQDVDEGTQFDTTSGWMLAATGLVAEGAADADGFKEVLWEDKGAADRRPVTDLYGRYYVVSSGGSMVAGEPVLHDGVSDGQGDVVGAGAHTEGYTGTSGAAPDVGGEELEYSENEPAWNLSASGETNAVPTPEPVWSGRIIYVDQRRGNDSFTGRSIISSANDGPKRTIEAGLIACPSDGIVAIRDGRYAEPLNVAGRDVRVLIFGRVNLAKGPIEPEPLSSVITNAFGVGSSPNL